jgi:AbrB family looped-hinge helix DNA binding protein
MTEYCWIKVTEGGRVVIPSRIRETIGVSAGDELLLAADADSVRLFTFQQAISDAQALVAKYIPPNADLLGDLKAMRQAEFAKDQHDL